MTEPLPYASVSGRPRSLTFRDVGLLLARLIVGGLMVYVSIHKLQDPVAFLKLVKQYELVPIEWYAALNSVAVIVPWIELLGGAALILGIGLRGTATVFLVMLCGFTTAIVLRTLNIMNSEEISFFRVEFDCGCGTGTDIIWIKLIENTVLILLSLLVVLSRSRRYCMSALLARTPEPK